MCDGRFLGRTFGPRGWRAVFDQEELTQTLQGDRVHLGLPGLNVRSISRDPCDFLVVGTNAKNGTGDLLGAKKKPIKAIRATTAIPGCCDPVRIDGEDYYDGAWGDPLPGTIVRKFWARRILVIMSQPPYDELTPYEVWNDQLVSWFANLQIPSVLHEGTRRMGERIAQTVRILEQCNWVRALVVYPKPGTQIAQWEQNSRVLRKAYECGVLCAEEMIAHANA
jgi:predicted patatin/cPLA2 family phospholipase